MPNIRKPTKVKELQGTLQKCRTNFDEPELPIESPDCPYQLEGEARAEWNRVTSELELMGVLATVDRAAVAAYCTAWAEMWEPNDMTKTAAIQQVRQFVMEFGLTPASRSRVSSRKKKGSDNPFQQFKKQA